MLVFGSRFPPAMNLRAPRDILRYFAINSMGGGVRRAIFVR
jgi:hypothetical protein